MLSGGSKLGLGFGVVGEMLEEGEACFYQNDDDEDESTVDPDVALSYLDEKVDHVLGHFQKDFEGGVSAENLGSKFGGYGSFLPTYQPSPALSHPRTPPNIQNHNASTSPNSLRLEGGRCTTVPSSVSVPAILGPAAVRLTSLPALKASCVDDCGKQEAALLSTHAKSKSEIYSGLGLDVSPTSSLEDRPTDSQLSREPQVSADESPTSILEIMTAFPVSKSLLLSPLPNDLICLTEKEKHLRESRSVAVLKNDIKTNMASGPKGRESAYFSTHVSYNVVEDIKTENGKDSDNDIAEAMGSINRPNNCPMVEKNICEYNSSASRERSNGKKINMPSTLEPVTLSVVPPTGIRPTSDAAAPAAPLVEEDWVCCDKCQKWRLLPVGTNTESLPKIWLCSMLYWLDGMNQCSISEEETTKAVISLHQIPAPVPVPVPVPVPQGQSSQNRYPGGTLPGVMSVDALWVDKSHHDNQDGSAPFSNSVQKNPQEPVKSRCLNGENQSPSLTEVDFSHSGRSNDLFGEKQRHKEKDKNKLLEIYTGEGDTKSSKIRNKRETDQDFPKASKKLKANSVHHTCEDWKSDNGGPVLKVGDCSGTVLSINETGMDHHKYDNHPKDLKESVRSPENKTQFIADARSLDMGKYIDRDVKKRKINEYRDTRDLVKRDMGSTSSYSKVSGSHKNKANFQEVKGGSPVESVSSSPRRGLNQDRFTSTKMNVGGKVDSQDASVPTTSPRKCSGSEDGGDRMVRKAKTITITNCGSLDTSVFELKDNDLVHISSRKSAPEPVCSPKFATHHVTDILQGDQYPCKPQTSDQCRNGENVTQYHFNGSCRKSGKECSSPQSKDKSRSTRSEYNKDNNLKTSEVSENGKKSKVRSRSQEKIDIYSEKEPKTAIPKRDPAGNLLIEIDKRKSWENMPLDRYSERSSMRYPLDKVDQVDVSGKMKSNSIPPPGRVQNESTHGTQPISGSHKENSASISSADATKGDDALKAPRPIKKGENENGYWVRDLEAPTPVRRDLSSQVAATNAVKEAKDLKHLADRVKNSGSALESTGLYFQAALKFLHGASLLESCNSETTKHTEMIQSMQMYSSTAKLCEFCAHEYEKSKEMAYAALAYKCVEVAYLRVINSSHASASKDRHDLQAALQIVPPGESPSSCASDVDNLNNPVTVDKVGVAKGTIGSPHIAGTHVIAAQNRSNFVRLLNFAQDVNFAMEASRKSRIAFAAANSRLEETKYREGMCSVKKALDFNFQDVEGLLRLVRLAMEAISPLH